MGTALSHAFVTRRSCKGAAAARQNSLRSQPCKLTDASWTGQSANELLQVAQVPSDTMFALLARPDPGCRVISKGVEATAL